MPAGSTGSGFGYPGVPGVAADDHPEMTDHARGQDVREILPVGAALLAPAPAPVPGAFGR
jgi:hypothetical protein